MPSKKNTKETPRAGQPVRPARSKGSAHRHGPTSGAEDQPRDAAIPQPGDPGAQDTGTPLPGKAGTRDELDEELALTFLTLYHTFEQALVRAGYTRASRTPGSARADWERFARHIEDQFDPDSSPVLQGAVAYLLFEQKNLDLRNKRLDDAFPWDVSSPHSDIVWISVLIQQTWNQLTHWINFMGTPDSDISQVMAAMFVLEAWAGIDPEVKRLLISA
jgi:hypothetical protein